MENAGVPSRGNGNETEPVGLCSVMTRRWQYTHGEGRSFCDDPVKTCIDIESSSTVSYSLRGISNDPSVYEGFIWVPRFPSKPQKHAVRSTGDSEMLLGVTGCECIPAL